MTTITTDPLQSLLQRHLSDWQIQLQAWAASGALVQAAQRALHLTEVPRPLRDLNSRLAAGDWSDIPRVEILNGSGMGGAIGAWASSTQTIYLNSDWLTWAESAGVINVLTEELGHFLDLLFNREDTQGDEGELFAQFLTADERSTESIRASLTESDGVILTLINGAQLNAEAATITGGEGDDTLTGTDSADTISGRAGNDLINGKGGDDELLGDDGDDSIFGGAGNDRINGGTGSDMLYGEEGNDIIYSGTRMSLPDPELFKESLLGKDSFWAGSGDDIGSVGRYTVSADMGDGDDELHAARYSRLPDSGFSPPTLSGGGGYDTLIIEETFEDNSGQYYINPLSYFQVSGFERIKGDLSRLAFTDEFFGGIISGRIVLEGGFTHLDASRLSTPVDIANINSDRRDRISTLGTRGNDTYVEIKRLDIPRFMTLKYTDFIYSPSSRTGGGGNDVFQGNGGNDYFNGGDGVDTAVFSGNASDYSITEVNYNEFQITDNRPGSPDGTDTIVDVNILRFSDGEQNVVIRGLNIVGDDSNEEISGGENADYIDGAGGNDVLQGLSGNDTVLGGAGDDLIIGGNGRGNDRYTGGTGVDTVRYTSALAGITVDLTRGYATSTGGGDSAGIGSDSLNTIENVIAGKFNDTIVGDNQNNAFRGESGNDLITGLGGADRKTGGSGKDIFQYTSLSDSRLSTLDRITDLAIGTDRIDAPRAVTARNLKQLGKVSSLTQQGVTRVLGSNNALGKRAFGAHRAATFTIGAGKATRTFLAVNDKTAGFNANTDALIEITGFTGNLNNLAIF